MIREIKSRTENNDYLLIDKKNNITGATKNFLKQTGLLPQHFGKYFFNLALFCPELKMELSGVGKNINQIIKRKEQKRKRTLVLNQRDSRSTSTNMLKMMKMNHKMMMNSQSLTNDESSDEEDIHDNGYFTGKLKIPADIKAILNEYTKSIIDRMTNVVKEPKDEIKKKGIDVTIALKKMSKKSFTTMLKRKGTKDPVSLKVV